jgi:dsDNA-binding SOS-regulon protein
MDELLKQAPDNISKEEIESIYLRNNKNVLDTLTELWKIPVKNVQKTENEKKWQEIREIYDDIDTEMYKVLRGQKK